MEREEEEKNNTKSNQGKQFKLKILILQSISDLKINKCSLTRGFQKTTFSLTLLVWYIWQ